MVRGCRVSSRHASSGRANGFTLLEILLVVVVIGVVSTMMLPRLFKQKPQEKWATVLDELNNLVSFARQEAISHHNTYRLHFQITKDGVYTVKVEVEGPHPEKVNQKIYTVTKSYYFNPTYNFPSSITILAIYHGREEQFNQNRQHAYCYVIPNGLVQEILMHLVRKKDGKESKVTFQMAPFFGKFELQTGLIRPKK